MSTEYFITRDGISRYKIVKEEINYEGKKLKDKKIKRITACKTFQSRKHIFAKKRSAWENLPVKDSYFTCKILTYY